MLFNGIRITAQFSQVATTGLEWWKSEQSGSDKEEFPPVQNRLDAFRGRFDTGHRTHEKNMNPGGPCPAWAVVTEWYGPAGSVYFHGGNIYDYKNPHTFPYATCDAAFAQDQSKKHPLWP